MRVVWLVSPNGLGHARRALGIASALLERRSGVHLTFCLEAWQWERLADDPLRPILEKAGARLITGILGDAPRWPHRGEADLMAWQGRLPRLGLGGTDLVVSDNLAADHREMVMCGSFLWSDILEPLAASSPAVARFVEAERELLAKHRPVMIAVEDLAMPGVRARTDMRGVGWMARDAARGDLAERASVPAHAPVAILGGASGAADATLAALARELAPGTPLVLSADLARRDDVPAAPVFDQSAAAYASCRLVVCRPGVGTLTDALAASRPLMVLDDGDSLEMRHNADRLEALGVARRLPPGAAAEQAEAVRGLATDTDALGAMATRAAALDMGGLAKAAALLEELA
jgi:hypothetical protein